jgi:hypothetical protein
MMRYHSEAWDPVNLSWMTVSTPAAFSGMKAALIVSVINSVIVGDILIPPKIIFNSPPI